MYTYIYICIHRYHHISYTVQRAISRSYKAVICVISQPPGPGDSKCWVPSESQPTEGPNHQRRFQLTKGFQAKGGRPFPIKSMEKPWKHFAFWGKRT